MPSSEPSSPAPSGVASLGAKLELPWVRHALALGLALVVPLALRAGGAGASRGTGFLEFLALALGFGVFAAGAMLFAWWLYTEWLHTSGRGVDPDGAHWRLGEGPTRFTRHPAWLAVMFLVIAQALIGMSAWLVGWALLVVTGLNALVRRHDEPRLAQVHGLQYDAYRARVPRWLPWHGLLQALREIGQVLRNSIR